MDAACVDGSSPHAWGTPQCWRRSAIPRRFIPTRVGNTQYGVVSVRGVPVHPHTRGEHFRSAMLCLHLRGSSPHAWGTRRSDFGRRFEHRFIPTRVGNTDWRIMRRLSTAVHPHTRGEHTLILAAIARAAGSSPHAWGTPAQSPRPSAPTRFIPTRVGNTCPIAATVRAHPVHPHTRGEHRQAPLESPCVAGSSPHAWGTLL